ncbi:MAG: hypothetical protein B6I20_13935 [Bacteroidetes bacterium 4572_117]|nr:MAG: hypothetical protein B6I20_13935 [Bacteroidetes bacterium 4572_117]
MKNLTIIIFTIFLTQLSNNAEACTLFWSSRNNTILAAKNMDWANTDARMLFIPASEGKFGRVYFGIESQWGFTNTSGMNEHGLWYAGASLPERTVYNTHNKPRWDYELIEKIMEECITVEDAIEIFSTYWEPHWDGHSLIADKYGNCVCIEYGEDDVVYIHNQADYQVATNFYLSDSINNRWYNCYRYNTANEILKSNSEISFDLFRTIADETHAEGSSNPTTLTTIHDLIKGEIQLYYSHNFNEVLKINLFEELEKGEHYMKCPDFFTRLKLCSPEKGESVESNKITFTWKGDASKYYLHYSKNKDFSEYEVVKLNKNKYVKANFNTGILGLSALVFLFLFKKRKKVLIVFSSILIITFSHISCKKDNIEPQFSNQLHSITLENFEPDTQYYWKILVSEAQQMQSESIVYDFHTY